MTVINNELRAKIEVGSYFRIEVTSIISTFIIGEIITGAVSGNTAEVTKVSVTGDDYIYVKNITGLFEVTELLNGSISGLGVTDGVSLTDGMVKSYQQRIPATITSTFQVDETVSGVNSTAFAKVAIQANPGDTYIVIKRRTRYFDSIEPLVGSVTGSGDSTGSMVTGDQLYTNLNYGIKEGLWTLETVGKMIANIADSGMKINIDKGGNVATGYQFGFSLANFGLVDAIDGDGLFLKHLPVRYYIDFGNGYVQMWTGIVDTFPKTGDTTADFKCTDLAKSNVEKFGSDKIPITFGNNYKCKLVIDDKKETVYYGANIATKNIVEFIPWNFIAGKPKQFAVHVLENVFSPLGFSANYESNFNNGFIEVLMGDDAGSVYKILNVTYKLLNPNTTAAIDEYTFSVDKEVSALTVVSGQYGQKNSSILRVVSRANTYALSKKQPLLIHKELSNLNQSPLTIVDNEIEFPISIGDNWSEYEKQGTIEESYFGIELNSLEKNDDMQIFSSFPVSRNQFDITSQSADGTEGGYYVKEVYVQFALPSSELLNLDELVEKGVDTYIHIDDILVAGVDRPVNSGEYVADVKMKIIAPYDNWIFGIDSQEAEIIEEFQIPDVTATAVGVGGILYKFDESFKSNSDLFKIDRYSNSDSITQLIIQVTIRLKRLLTPWTDLTGVIQSPPKITYGGNVSTKDLSVGCIGENVSVGNTTEDYPNAIKYLQENYINIHRDSINVASYEKAESDFKLYPGVTSRNPAHQIEQQADSNSTLTDMLVSSHLGLFQNRKGEFTLDNWLPKSTVFSDTQTVIQYNSTNWLKDGIGKIERSQITQVISDFQLDYDFNESTGNYDQVMRIKNTSADIFDFVTCTEGVSIENQEIAQQAWELLHAGYLRAKKETQSTLQSNWIKMSLSDGTGESEAINFIRNQSGHVNRELEKVTIKLPLNATNAILDLLSFISVQDVKRTNNETRAGWIIEQKISWNKKEISFKVLLDLSQFDPFLVQIGIIQDTAFITDIIQNSATATTILQDGAGK